MRRRKIQLEGRLADALAILDEYRADPTARIYLTLERNEYSIEVAAYVCTYDGDQITSIEGEAPANE